VKAKKKKAAKTTFKLFGRNNLECHVDGIIALGGFETSSDQVEDFQLSSLALNQVREKSDKNKEGTA
jgi:hypothetical protein